MSQVSVCRHTPERKGMERFMAVVVGGIGGGTQAAQGAEHADRAVTRSYTVAWPMASHLGPIGGRDGRNGHRARHTALSARRDALQLLISLSMLALDRN